MRRQRMLALLEVASGQSKFSAWVKYSETISASKTEKLEYYLQVLYAMLGDLLLLKTELAPRRNPDLAPQLSRIAAAVTIPWIEKATGRVDELVEFGRRNVQKGIALDAFAVDLRR
jgi:DNA polymerase-3 subunit delta'